MPRLEDLELQIKQTSTNLKGITNMANALSRLSQSSGKTNIAAKSIKELNSAIKGIKSDKASALASVASALARLASTAMSASSISSSIRQVGISINGLTESIDVEKITALASALRDIKTAASSVKGLQAVKNAAMGGGPTAGGVKSLGDSVSNKTETGDAIEQVGENAEEAAPKVDKFRKSLQSVSKAGSGLWKHLGGSMWESLKKRVSDTIKPLANLYNSFKRIAMYRALRTALKEITQGFATGVKNLYAWAGLVGNSFVGTMDSLATSMNYLRNSLGAMVSPLLDALAPAVDALVDKFVDLVNLVNQFFATMTGKTTWRKALKTQKEYADNTDDAAKAQARLNHQLMAFDELNNISVSNPSGRGGGGKNDGVTSDDFEELELPDWAQDIKDAIDRGDWAGAGEALADKLNGIIEDWDSYSAGQLLGQKINNVLSFYVSFMDKFDWAELGKKFAGYVNGVFNSIDPQTLGQAMVAHIKAAFEFLANFIPNVDVSNIALAFSTAINELFSDENAVNVGQTIAGVINKGIEFLKTMITGGYIEKRIPGTDKVIREWVDGIDFKQVGYGIFEAIGTAITNIKWEDLGTAIQKLAGGIVDMFNGACDWLKEHPSDVTDAIKDFFSGLWGENGEGFKNLLNLATIVAGLKLAFSAVFGDNGLVSHVKDKVKELIQSATAGIGGVGGASVIGMAIMLEINLIGDAIDNIKKYGLPEGIFKTVGKDAPWVNQLTNILNGAEPVTYIAEGLYRLKLDLDSGEFDRKMNEFLQSDEVQNAIQFVNALLRLAGLEEIQFKVTPYGLKGAADNAKILTGKTGLGGIKATYNTKVTAGGLTANTRNAQDYGKAFKLVDGKTATTTFKAKDLITQKKNSYAYRSDVGWLSGRKTTTSFNASGLKEANTYSTTYKKNTSYLNGLNAITSFVASGLKDAKTSSTTYKSNTKWLKGLTATTSFVGKGLSTNADYANDMRSDLAAMNGKKFSTTLTTSGITQAETSTSNITKNLDYATSKPWKIKAEFSYQSSLPPGVIPGVGGMASGGFPSVGSMFVAGEAGPELVGTINGRNAVVSGGEISGISDAVYDTGEAETALLQQLLTVGRQLLAKSGNVTLAPNAAAGRWVAQSQAAYARATGG